MKNRTCVVRVDGGICSQLAFVAYGMAEGEPGETVKYDLNWFRDHGLDVLGEQVRNWDVFKLLPGLKIDVATDEEIRLAREGREGYRYVSGYPDRDRAFLECAWLFKSLMKPKLDPTSAKLLDQIRNVKSCAIHVRRGDLAQGNADYGSPTTLDYFKRAIGFERARSGGQAVFFVFTDDVRWTSENVMPLIGGGGQFMREWRGQGLCRLVSHGALRCDHLVHRKSRRLCRRAVGQKSGLVSVAFQEVGARRRERRVSEQSRERRGHKRIGSLCISQDRVV